MSNKCVFLRLQSQQRHKKKHTVRNKLTKRMERITNRRSIGRRAREREPTMPTNEFIFDDECQNHTEHNHISSICGSQLLSLIEMQWKKIRRAFKPNNFISSTSVMSLIASVQFYFILFLSYSASNDTNSFRFHCCNTHKNCGID